MGDGGKSWLHKAYNRAVKQAKEQGISLEEIISKRWGVSFVAFTHDLSPVFYTTFFYDSCVTFDVFFYVFFVFVYCPLLLTNV